MTITRKLLTVLRISINFLLRYFINHIVNPGFWGFKCGSQVVD